MPIPPFSGAQLEVFAQILGAAFKGSELSRLLSRANLPDANPTDTKSKRLLAVFEDVQQRYRVGSHVGTFLQVALEPALWQGRAETFESTRAAINQSLAFSGLKIGEDGKLTQAPLARTLAEAEARAEKLRAAMRSRGVHPEVLRFCRAELLDENYFHAVLEATESVAAKVREMSGLTSDGAELVEEACGGSPSKLPKLAFNQLSSPTQWGEHRGLANVMKGMFGAFRNPAAHEPKITWVLEEQDALDLLTLASLLHRRLDRAFRTGL